MHTSKFCRNIHTHSYIRFYFLTYNMLTSLDEYTHTHTHVHVHLYARIRVRMHIEIHMYICLCISKCICLYRLLPLYVAVMHSSSGAEGSGSEVQDATWQEDCGLLRGNRNFDFHPKR